MNKWTQIPSACATSIKETWRPFSPATSSLLSLSPFFPSGLPWEGWTLFGLELKFRGRGRSSINLVSYIFGGLRFLFLVFLFLFLIFLLSWRRCSINLASKNFTPKRLPLAASNNLDPKMRFSIGKSPDVTSSPFKGRLIKPCKQLFLTAPATRHELGNQKIFQVLRSAADFRREGTFIFSYAFNRMSFLSFTNSGSESDGEEPSNKSEEVPFFLPLHFLFLLTSSLQFWTSSWRTANIWLMTESLVLAGSLNKWNNSTDFFRWTPQIPLSRQGADWTVALCCFQACQHIGALGWFQTSLMVCEWTLSACFPSEFHYGGIQLQLRSCFSSVTVLQFDYSSSGHARRTPGTCFEQPVGDESRLQQLHNP